MDAAFDKYFALSDVLLEDLSALLDTESETQHWRRNYIRVSASLIEGYLHSFREMAAVSLACVAPEISEKEKEVLNSQRGFSTPDRYKLTLRAAHKLFEVGSAPNFGSSEWSRAKQVFKKRDSLMHPKKLVDFEIANGSWEELRFGISWLIEQLFNFVLACQRKYAA